MPKRKPEGPSKVDNLVAQAEQRQRDEGQRIEHEPYSLGWYREEWPARKRIFIERELKVRNAFHRNKKEDFILNDAQLELLQASLESSADPSLEDVVLKCRRLGISTYYIADYLSDAIMESGHHVRIVAHDRDTLKALMKVVKFFYNNLLLEIRPKHKYNAKYDLEFDDPEKECVNSSLSVSTVQPGDEEKGRGDTITRLHRTEVPFWKGDPETAAVALGDAAKGGKITDESTAKGVGDFFHKRYVQGRQRDSSVRSHFFEWWWNINYQIDGAYFFNAGGVWYLLKANQQFDRLDEEQRAAARLSAYSKEEKTKEGYPLQSERDCAEAILAFLKAKGYVGADDPWTHDEVARRIAWRRAEIKNKGAKKFRVEYPENDVDPFALTGGAVFDNSYLDLKAEPRGPEIGHTYVVWLDPSIGIEGADPAACGVIDRVTGEDVHQWAGYEKQDAQGKRVCDLSDQYNGAEIVIESNMGEAAILECENRGYGHRLYRDITPQMERDIKDGKMTMREAMNRARPGVNMSERVKRLVINLFEKAWREGDFKCAHQELIDEARVFVQVGITMAAKSGHHDDRIMGCAIGWYVVVTSSVGVPDFRSTGVKMGSAMLKGF